MWFIFALLGAVGKAYSGFFRKRVAKSVSGSMFIWFGYTLTLILLTPFMIPQFSDVIEVFVTLPLVLLGTAVSYMIATQLNLEALKREDLSYTAPLNAFVPVFTLIIAIVFLNEKPPAFGIAGVFAVVAGAYIVSIKPDQINWYAPLKRLLTSSGAQLSLGVAFFYAINTVLFKVISNEGYNAFVVLYAPAIVGWLLLLHVPITKLNELKGLSKADKAALLGGGLSSFAASLFHILALANTFASYAVSVRRLDSVFSVLLGWRYLNEKNIRVKLLGSIVMTTGAVIMVISI